MSDSIDLSKPTSHSGVVMQKLSKPGLGIMLTLGSLSAFGPLSIDMYLPAFPVIAHSLAASAESIQQTLPAYFLGMALGQYFYGPLSDRFGRKKPLILGVLFYILSAIGCATARDVHSLVFWRVMQGLGGCSGMVISMAIVRDYFDVKEGARFMSQLMLITGAAPILAPFVGGQLLLHIGWRAIFFTQAFFGILCAFMVFSRLKETWGSHPRMGNLKVIAKTQFHVLTDKSFLFPTMCMAFSQSAMFAYIMSSPNVFIKHFGVPAEYFGFFFGTNAIGLIGATQINRRLLANYHPHQILSVSTFAAASVGLLLIAVAWSGLGGLWGIAISLFLLLFCLGFIGANGTACAMARQAKRAGSASALIGVIQSLVASLTGSLAVWAAMLLGPEHPQRSMAAVISLLTLIGCTIHWLGTKSVFDPSRRSSSGQNWQPLS